MNNCKKVSRDFTGEVRENLVEIVSVYKSCDVIDGGKVFISVDDCRIILSEINSANNEEEDKFINVMCKELLRKICENILFSNNVDGNFGSIIDKY